jgi:hypothetical protein
MVCSDFALTNSKTYFSSVFAAYKKQMVVEGIEEMEIDMICQYKDFILKTKMF